jgi:hypothetical protein
MVNGELFTINLKIIGIAYFILATLWWGKGGFVSNTP